MEQIEKPKFGWKGLIFAVLYAVTALAMLFCNEIPI